MAKTGILLESGTNELEIAEFYLDKQSYGINVAKIREIVLFDPDKVTRFAGAQNGVLGTILFRGHSIVLVNLPQLLNLQPPPEGTRQVVLVSEFNQRTTAFLVDGVARIHRISWAEFTPIHPLLGTFTSYTTGSFHIDKREILILDFESILNDLFPETRMHEQPEAEKSLADRRANLRVFIVEDSRTIQALIISRLKGAGVTRIKTFSNGRLGLEALQQIAERKASGAASSDDDVDLVVSDIEMPELDGLSFCKQMKNTPGLARPIIMFSSLITEEMARKCRDCGADRWVSKPELDKVIGFADELCLGASPSHGS
ncbi:MAG TPA: chemotaxis protein [Candidatus Ozemobacteraceae bacterium]|nr:chemotaxis protein [Candidatus Ozemobacteraceae bacterium]